MNLFEEYLDEIATRKQQGLSAKPIDNGDLAREIIAHIKSIDNKYHDECVDFLIFNMLPGTTKAANEKAEFLKQIINDNYQIDEISIDRAFELGTVEGLRPEEVKKYMRYMADIRLNQLKLQPIYKIGTNPLPWLDEMLNAVEHTNFFENRAT